MLDHTETAALKALQARAYGRDAILTTDELAQLRELEAKRRGVAEGDRLRLPSVAQPVSTPAAAQPPLNDPQPEPRGSLSSEPEPRGSLSSQPEPRGSLSERSETKRVEQAERVETTSPPRRPRFRWLLAAAATLAIGVGIGWSIWGQTHNEIELTDEQRGWQDELAAEKDYDPGSFVALREDSKVVVWTATRSDGKQTCLLMSNGTESSTTCQLTKGIRAQGLWLDLQVPTGEEETFDVTTANLLFTADGHPAVATDHYRNSYANGVVYEPEEQKAVDLLIDHGYQQSSLWIVGYFEERPIFSGAYARSDDEQCLVYVATSGAIEEDCGTWEESLDDPLTLTIGPDGAGSRAAEIVYASSLNGPQYLTITVQPVSGVTVDTETGDVIEFTVDEPMFDDLVGDAAPDE